MSPRHTAPSPPSLHPPPPPALQASYDPNNITRLLQQAPYHVDSLLSMHDLYRHMGGCVGG